MTEIVLVANAADGTITTLALHREPTPRLEHLATSADVPGCSTFAMDAERDLVFASFKAQPSPGIATLRLDRSAGQLTELSRTHVEASLSYLSLTDDAGTLLGVSYSGGVGMAWPVGEDGTLAAPHSRFEHRNLHAIIQAGDFVYAPSLGDDLVAQFRLDAGRPDVGRPVTGRLVPLDPPTVSAPAGSGPRHAVAHAGSVYVVTEFSGEVVRYLMGEDGTLTEAERVVVVDPAADLGHSRFGADPMAEHLIWGADIHVAGGWVLTSERTSSQVASTRLDDAGQLGEVVAQTAVETQPRGFAASPDGRFAVMVGERSTHAALFEVGVDGSLTQVDRTGIGAGANWVRFV